MEEGVFPLGSDPHEGVFRSVSEAEVSLDEMLSLACRQGKQDIVELLLESGANVNHRNKAGNTPLLEACSQGHVSIARLLLDRSADIDAPTETTYDSALTWACTLGNVDIVRLLLDRKANVEHRTKDGCTALMFAALAGHEKVAKLLLDHRAEINVESDSNKDSPLTFACWKGHQKVVELFLERTADIEHRTKEGFSPLMFAALGGHTQVAELLLKHHAEVNNPSGSNNDIPLTSACWKGHHQVVYLLLQHSSDIEHRTKDGCTPLMLAAREGHLSVAQLLLDHGAKVNMPSGSENNIPLTLACWKGHRDVVNLLLKNVSNIEHQNKAGCTPLMLAAREGHQEATRLLLDSGAQINVPSGSNDDTPLTLACWKGHGEVVSLLIERNSNVNHQTKTGCTPLMEATREGHVGVAKLLLEAGADVETPDNYGQSPFFMACWKGHADVAALLLEYDANKDCRTKTGITPLFQACRENHVDVVKLLLDYGCNPSTPFPNSRECPLTLAAEKGYVELTQLLLSRSAHVEARTKKGCSPLYLACREGFKEIAVMLAKHGASTEAPDLRSTTPLLAAYKNGHFEVVEWLLAHVAHLPSDPECNKALLAPMPLDTDLGPQRSKCIELIMKAKKAREQAALKNAQILCDELDAEREKKESRRKAAAKKRDKRKKKKKQDKMDALEVEEGVETLPSSLTPAPPSALDPPRDGHAPRKGGVHGKKAIKQGAGSNLPEVDTPFPIDDGSDSGDEYHDALPEFLPTEPSDRHKENLPSSALTSRPYPSTTDHPLPSSSSSTTHETKYTHTSLTDMSSTRHGGAPSNKRSPQPKAEGASSASKSSTTGSNRRNEGSSSVERSKNEHVPQGKSSDSAVNMEKRKGKSGHTHHKTTASERENNSSTSRVAKEGNWGKSTSPTASNLPIATKGASSDVPIATRGASSNISIATKGATSNVPIATRGASTNSTKGTSTSLPKGATPKGAPTNLPIATKGAPINPPIATKGVSSNTSTAVPPKPADTSIENKTPHSTRGKAASKQTLSRGHRSNQTPSSSLESAHGLVRENSPSIGSSTNESTSNSYYSSSSKATPTDAVYHTSSSSDGKDYRDGVHSPTTTTTMSGGGSSTHEISKPPPVYDGKDGYSWTSSQDSDASWNDVELDNQIMWSRCTDDDKLLRSRKLKVAQQSVPLRPSATSAYPTPTSNTSTSSITHTSQSWQEVTRPTRTVQLTVSNSLVGRIIGRKGSKINNIQVSSGAHINVSRNIPKSTERLITIKGTQRSISKAQELIDEALTSPDSTVEVTAPSPDLRGPKIDPIPPTSPSLLNTRSDSPLSTGDVPHPRQVKQRYSDVLTLQAPQSNSPVQQEAESSLGGGTQPPPSLLTDSDDDRTLLSPLLVLSSEDMSVEGETGRGEREMVNMNSDFPPLSIHSRSRSDPQMVSLGDKDDGNESLELTRSLTCNIPPKSSSISTPSLAIETTPLNIETTPSDSSDPVILSPSLSKEQLSPYVALEEVGGEKGEEDGGYVTSLAVGTCPPKESNVTIIQPTQQEPSSQLMPPISQSNSTPDLSSFPFGPIGPPTRRKSLPSSAFKGPHRKTSHGYSATLENVGENDSLHSLPASFPTPPINSSHSSTWPNDHRRRSTSLIGQHPYVPQNGQFSNPPHSQFKVPPHSSSSHIHHAHHQSDEPLGSPDTPHGENHPMTEQDFSTVPSGLGPIGTGAPHSRVGTDGGVPVPSISGAGVPHSRVGADGGGGGGPVYSNNGFRLPHPPPPMPPLNMKIPSEIWISPYRAGPRVHHMPPQMISQPPPTYGHPFLPPPNHPSPFPSGGMHKSDPSHHTMLQRVGSGGGGGGGTALGHQQKPPGPHGDPGMVPNMGMRHSFGEGSDGYRVDLANGNPIYHQKRWSVPNFPYSPPPPPYPPNQGQMDGHYPWGAWAKQGGMDHKPTGNNLNGQHFNLDQAKGFNLAAGGPAILSDSGPWSPQWTTPPGGVGFPSPPPIHRHNGPTLKPNEDSPGKLKMGRSISCVTEPSWRDLEVGVAGSGEGGGTDLLQLMKSLDISSEHMQSLKARKLSLQQLHTMSDEEWRKLKLPVGPRVKLMNAISNIHGKSGPGSQGSDSHSSEASPLSTDGSVLAT